MDNNKDIKFEFSGKIVNTKKQKTGTLATIQFENSSTAIEDVLKEINKAKL